MAKLRVYELARDLNMTNKVLIAKLNDMDIEVKSHMSALDDEAVSTIKSSLFGAKEETVEETRIKPTVIRRRRKTVQIEVAPPPEEDEQDADAAEAQKDAVAEEVEQKAAPEEVAVEEPETEEEPVVEEKPPVEEPVKPPKPRKKEPSAKIIKLPVKPPEKPLKEKKAARAKGKVESIPSRKVVAEPASGPDEIKPSDKKKRKHKKKIRRI